MTVVFNQFLNLMLDENLYQAGTSCAGTDANKAVIHSDNRTVKGSSGAISGCPRFRGVQDLAV